MENPPPGEAAESRLIGGNRVKEETQNKWKRQEKHKWRIIGRGGDVWRAGSGRDEDMIRQRNRRTLNKIVVELGERFQILRSKYGPV